MGQVQSTGGSRSIRTKASDESSSYEATKLQAANPEFYKKLQERLLPYNLEGLADKICIATKTVNTCDYETYDLKISDHEILPLIEDIIKIASLPTGLNTLKMLNGLLEKQNSHLVICFVLDKKQSPSFRALNFQITPADVSLQKKALWNSITINLPLRYEDHYQLPFYDTTTREVVIIKEPTFLVIAHELIHGIQFLKYVPSAQSISASLKEEFIQTFGELEYFIPGRDQYKWLEEFFAGTTVKDSWPDELSAMILGIAGEVDGDIIIVSEQQALFEYLSAERLPGALSAFKGHRLIPFGHGKQKTSKENIDKLKDLLRLTIFEQRKQVDLIQLEEEDVEQVLSLPITFDSETSQISDDEIEVLKIVADEMEVAEQYITTITRELSAQGYQISDVTADGNCGFYAILKSLNPAMDFSKVQKDSVEWKAAKALREAIAQKPGLGQLATMTETAAGTENQQLGADALPHVAQHYGRPVVMIDSTEKKVIVYEPNKEPVEKSLEEALQIKDPIILLHTPGHWQAIIKTN